jgi:hypothetical protein
MCEDKKMSAHAIAGDKTPPDPNHVNVTPEITIPVLSASSILSELTSSEYHEKQPQLGKNREHQEPDETLVVGPVIVRSIEINECDLCGYTEEDWQTTSIAGSASSGSRILKQTSDWFVGYLGSLSYL